MFVLCVEVLKFFGMSSFMLLLIIYLMTIQCQGMTSETSMTTPSSPYLWSASSIFCDFESECAWEYTRPTNNNAGFRVISYEESKKETSTADKTKPPLGPETGPENETNGHFLLLLLQPKINYTNQMVQVRSPFFEETSESCRLEAHFFIKNFNDIQMPIKILVENQNNTIWVDMKSQHMQMDQHHWNLNSIPLGRITNRFRVIIEVVLGHQRPATVAIDNVKLVNCITDIHNGTECHGIRCDNSNKCIPRDHICDITRDCPKGEDESGCDRIPEGARCDFEGNSTCKWRNVETALMTWHLHQGHTLKDRTGPSFDHTYGNKSGFYMLSEPSNEGNMGDEGILESPTFPPPPCYHRNPDSRYFNTCKLRLYYHKMGKSTGGIGVFEVIDPNDPKLGRHPIDQKGGDKGSRWVRFTGSIPTTVNFRYRVRVINVRGVRATGDIGLDDISLSPECFGIGVPEDEVKKCPPPPATTIGPDHLSYSTTPYKPPPGTTVHILNTCGAIGNKGPTEGQCKEYSKSHNITVPPGIHFSPVRQGMQTWKVPHDGYYTLIAKGASGGSGVLTQNIRTRGAIARGIFLLKKGTDVHILVGQEGLSACQPKMNAMSQVFCDNSMDPPDDFETIPETGVSRLLKIKNKTLPGGGGGGGGASYIFLQDSKEITPLVIGAGGAGLGWLNSSPFTSLQHGRGPNISIIEGVNGESLYNGSEGAGPGGGMEGKRVGNSAGYPLKYGGDGGSPCSSQWNAYGGFGGGGGGCISGGGGGGYVGGNANDEAKDHGEGGISFATGLHAYVKPASNIGPGMVFIIPTVRNECSCHHLCAHLDEHLNESVCLCTNEEELASDGITCIGQDKWNLSSYFFSVIPVFLLILFLSTALVLYFYRNKKRHLPAMGRDIVGGTEVQLNRLRASSGMMVTEYNPNYEFGGGTCTIKDLKEIPRESLTLIKALGQGAFGEVYKGYLKSYAGDSVDMPVAVKTLPEMSNSQAELDFLMEALIMSKFNHPNIVHFIGVCFDKLPRFIVLELLSGGDLKSFLRESRPKPDRPSCVTMKDLLQCAIDVAKGCEYLEANHFIHRDIAARNCLLTTKGPGRVVKIADFGMARDIYRNDYYRKGGKAMLPVKWMPPEAFLDGIFISKTDVWSFGVLLWEVMSLGYMPYPGRGNQEVMTLVTNGGRLEPPRNCPSPIYRIMAQCWHPNADERPNFSTILERLGYCIQDPDVVAATLPVFQRPPSTERDTTVMRPLEGEACLAVQRRGMEDPQSPASTDYLIPMSYSLSTVRSDLHSTPSLDSGTDCFQMERLIEDPTSYPPPQWETSFSDEPPPMAAPRAPQGAVAGAVAAIPSPSSPVHLGSIQEDSMGVSPLLLSPPASPSPPPPPRHQESRERLLRPGNEHSHTPGGGAVAPRERLQLNSHYHPHRYNNSGSSNNSSASSSSASSSSRSHSSSTASTLPLDPASLPCIPPPLQYVNVDVKKKTAAEYAHEPYTIIETREHREISC